MARNISVVSLLLLAGLVGSIMTTVGSSQTEGEVQEGFATYARYALVRLYHPPSGTTMLYTFDRDTGTLTLGTADNPEFSIMKLTEGVPEYKIVPNARGGAYVMNPETGKTWFIDVRGGSKEVLGVQPPSFASP